MMISDVIMCRLVVVCGMGSSSRRDGCIARDGLLVGCMLSVKFLDSVLKIFPGFVTCLCL